MGATSSFLTDPRFSTNLFFPLRTANPPPAGAQDLFVAVAPGVRLHARAHAADGAIAVVVLFHGNGEVVPDYDGQARLFAQAGARLVVVDYRGYGRSEGTPTLAALIEDAYPALVGICGQLAAELAELPVVVMGRSLGSACAAELAGRRAPRAAGFIYESGFADLVAFAGRRGVAVDRVEEADLALLCPLRKLGRSTAPLLVLHGESDRVIACAEGRAAYEASAAEVKEFVGIPGRGHNDLSADARYWGAMGRFLRKVAELAR